MRLVVWLGGTPIEFTAPGSGGPFPYLRSDEIGRLRNAVRAGYRTGFGVGEAPSITVPLVNQGNRAASILGQPLRAPAALYDDDDALVFAGPISEIDYTNFALTIEA